MLVRELTRLCDLLKQYDHLLLITSAKQQGGGDWKGGVQGGALCPVAHVEVELEQATVHSN